MDNPGMEKENPEKFQEPVVVQPGATGGQMTNPGTDP